MNRRAFVRHLVSYGCCIEREGKRHTELARGTVRAICDDLKIPVPF